MAKANNMVLVLSIILLMISVIGTFVMIEKISLNVPGEGHKSVQQGIVGFTILPTLEGDSATGRIGVAILPSTTP
jgi:hypothetical protein